MRFLIILTLLIAVTNGSDMSTEVETKFIENEITKDLKLAKGPTKLLEINYPTGVTVNLGNELTPTQVKDIPFLKWDSEGGDALYTVLMTDPDAPTRQNATFREVRHWLVVNVPQNEVKDGDHLFEFIGSGPPSGTGLHRYVFLIFKQAARIDVTNIKKTRNCSREGRLSSSAKTFIEEHNLGDPIYGNFYQAQYDDYVPELHKQLAGC